MSAAGLALLVIGLLAVKNDIAQARGLDKIVALTHLCFAIPLAVFGAEHLSGRNPDGPGAAVHAVAFVLGLFRRLCADRRIVEHRHQHSGALVRPAVRDHDVPFCGDDSFSGSGQQRRPNLYGRLSSGKCRSGGAAGFWRELRWADRVRPGRVSSPWVAC